MPEAPSDSERRVWVATVRCQENRALVEALMRLEPESQLLMKCSVDPVTNQDVVAVRLFILKPPKCVMVATWCGCVASRGETLRLAVAGHDTLPASLRTVWRTGRPQSAARADVLASHGMDEIEIPACLRKQADRAGAA